MATDEQKTFELAFVQRQVHGAIRALERQPSGAPRGWQTFDQHDPDRYTAGEDPAHDAENIREARLKYQATPAEISALNRFLNPMQFDDRFASEGPWVNFDEPSGRRAWRIVKGRAWQEWLTDDDRFNLKQSPWTWERIAAWEQNKVGGSLSVRAAQAIYKDRIEVAWKRHLVLLGRPALDAAA